jgi:hypothetical protein
LPIAAYLLAVFAPWPQPGGLAQDVQRGQGVIGQHVILHA